MIRPPDSWGKNYGGVAFSTSSDGDLRSHLRHQEGFSSLIGIGAAWATVDQVHGDRVCAVAGPGPAGAGDGVWTDQTELPVAVFTADCVGIAILADRSVGVVHAGWRGLAAGVVANLLSRMVELGHTPLAAAIGPSIGPCCFEVGGEVAERFPEDTGETTWGTPSVNLWTAAERRLSDIADVWSVGQCTMCADDFYSHRRDATPDRLATVAWAAGRD